MFLRSFPRRRLLNSLGGLALAAVLPACDRAVAQPLAVAAHVWPGYEPLFLAQREGWLDPARVRLTETASATESLQALAAGRVSAAALTLDEVLKARAAGLPLSVVMVFDVSAGADMVIARPDLPALADLRGRRIAYEQGALGDLMLALLLRAARLGSADIIPVPLAVDRQPEAWRAGHVDACICYEPVASQLLGDGGQVLFDSSQTSNLIVDVLAVRSELLDERGGHQALRELIAAHFRALHHMQHYPQDAAHRMAGHLGLPAEQVLRTFKGLQLPDAANNRRLLGGKAPVLLGRVGDLQGLMLGSGLLERRDDLSGLLNARFLPESDDAR